MTISITSKMDLPIQVQPQIKDCKWVHSYLLTLKIKCNRIDKRKSGNNE